MINIKDYYSRWNYMADRAEVSRTPKYNDPITDFQIVGRFVGEWDSEVSFLRQKYDDGIGFNFLTKLGSIEPYTKELDLHDMEEAGISKDHIFVQRITPKQIEESLIDIPIIKKMIDWFEFSGLILPKIHLQFPGQVFPYHFDDLTTHRNNSDKDIDPYKYARIEVMLKDWDHGHFWGIGNNVWKNWKAGEIMFHLWHSIPHGTANAGRTPRINLQITGEVTEQTLIKLNKDNGEIKL